MVEARYCPDEEEVETLKAYVEETLSLALVDRAMSGFKKRPPSESEPSIRQSLVKAASYMRLSTLAYRIVNGWDPPIPRNVHRSGTKRHRRYHLWWMEEIGAPRVVLDRMKAQ